MDSIPIIGDIVVYFNPPPVESGWRLPEMGTIFEVTNVVTDQGGEYPTHVRVQNKISSSFPSFTNVLIPEFLEYLDVARRNRIPREKLKTKNCCWTCRHLCSDTCEVRRKITKASGNVCQKPLNNEPSGFLNCFGPMGSRKGCGQIKPCWESFLFSLKLKEIGVVQTLQNNLIFPPCPR